MQNTFQKTSRRLVTFAAVVSGFLLLAGEAGAQGRTWRVRKDGSGDFTTITACVNAMAGGDTCLVGPGSYPERIKFPAGKSGTAARLTLVKAETPGTVDTWGADTVNCNFVRVEGFNISIPSTLTGWTDGVGVVVRSSNVEVVSNYIHDVHYAGVSGTANNILVRGNHTYKCGMGIVVGGSGWVVDWNQIERIQKYPELGDADHTRFVGQNHIIRSNHFYGTLEAEIGAAHVDGFQTFDDAGDSAQHILIEANWLEGFYHQGVFMEATFHTNTYDITIRNNVFIGAATFGVGAVRNMRDVKVYNNTFINPDIYGVRFTDSSTGDVKNNVFYSNKTGIPSGDIRELTYSADATCTMTGDHNLLYIPSMTISQSWYPDDIVNQNPLFANLAAQDFHVLSNSPAIDRGAALAAAVPMDLDSIARPQGAAWDIGAYEFHSVSRPVPPTNLHIIP